MRLNKYIAQATGMSRRAADTAIGEGRVAVNGQPPLLGQSVADNDQVELDGQPLVPNHKMVTIMLNKPPGYVCSRDGQGSRTVYELLPPEYHHLKPVGRLDKYSTGLLLLTNDGGLANQLTHPRYEKTKTYEVRLDKQLAGEDAHKVAEVGVELEDGPSKFELTGSGQEWRVRLKEGRNRQIRRTFEALGYTVRGLHRTQFGDYRLNQLQQGKYLLI